MAAKRKTPKKPRSVPSRGVAYEIADAKHVDKALGRHLERATAAGLTAADRLKFQATIKQAEALEVPAERAGVTSRKKLMDLIGAYRDAAQLASDGMEGVDAVLRKELRADGEFPESDAELEKYTTGLMELVTAHKDALSAKGFKKPQAEALEKAIEAYLEEIKQVPAQQGEAASAAKDRAAVFKMLRTQTRYLRKVGRTALKGSPARAQFDRVVVNEAAHKKAQRQSAAKAKAARAAKRAAKKTT